MWNIAFFARKNKIYGRDFVKIKCDTYYNAVLQSRANKKTQLWGEYLCKPTKHILFFALPAEETQPTLPSRRHSSRCRLNLSRADVLSALWESESPASWVTVRSACRLLCCSSEVNGISIINCSSCLFIVLWDWTPTASQRWWPGLTVERER